MTVKHKLLKIIAAFLLLSIAGIPLVLAKQSVVKSAGSCGATWGVALKGTFNNEDGIVNLQKGDVSQLPKYMSDGCDFKVHIKYPAPAEFTQGTPPTNLVFSCQTVTVGEVNAISFTCYSGTRYAAGGAVDSMQMADEFNINSYNNEISMSHLRHAEQRSGISGGAVMMVPAEFEGTGQVQVFVRK